MTDVEKYGVFALVFVLGVLGLIVFYEPGSGHDAAADGGQAVIIRSAADVPLTAATDPRRRRADDPARQPRPADPEEPRAASYRVRSPLDGAGSFDFTEPPIRYPGDRSSLGRPAKDGKVIHVIRQGETLSDISKRYFGTTTRWKEILRLNPGVDPKKMKPGDEIVVSLPSPAIKRSAPVVQGRTAPQEPVAHAATKAPAAASRTYTVKRGDTLGGIAKAMLGSATRADEIYAANRGVLKSPHDLTIGMELVIP